MLRCFLIIGLSAFFLISHGCSFGTEGKLAEEMKSSDSNVRKEAAVQLGEAGTPNALRILELAKDDPDFAVRDAVRASIAKINKQTFMK